MKNFLIPVFLVLSLLMILPESMAQSKKEEIKFWKRKAKSYVKQPLSLKSEFENYQNQARELKDKTKSLQKQLDTERSRVKETGVSNAQLVDSLKWTIIQKEGEITAQAKEFEKLEKAYKAQRKVNDMGIKPGLVYRVQIGAYVFYQMDSPPAGTDDFIAEKTDGFNKYVIGSFRTYDECAGFKEELRKLGVKDAWIVPYIDGIRVTMKEADNYLGSQGGNFSGQ